MQVRRFNQRLNKCEIFENVCRSRQINCVADEVRGKVQDEQ